MYRALHSQQNGVVERRNQTVVGMARSLLKSMEVPGEFWGEAVSTAIYLLNRAPTKSVTGKTPYEAYHNRKPSVEHFRIFGCMGHVKDVTPHLPKLADRSKLMGPRHACRNEMDLRHSWPTKARTNPICQDLRRSTVPDTN